MLFKRSLVHELYTTALASFLVLLGIMLAQRTMLLLGYAARGALASDAIGALLGFSLLRFLSLLLTLTVFIAVLMTLSRWHRDSEMVVWFTSGQGMHTLLKPILSFALPIIAVIACLSFFVTPWATQRGMDFREQLESRDEFSAVTPGVFKESKHADRVFFVERFSTLHNTAHNIFAQSSQHQKLGIIIANEGSQSITEQGDTYLNLMHGRRYEGTPNSSEFSVMQFEKYSLRTEPAEARNEPPTAKSRTTLQLLQNRSDENLAELQWRLSLPLSAFLLVLLAIPLSFVDPRAGRSANLIMAILVYLMYNNALSILQSWVARDKLSPLVGLWPAHLVVLTLLAYLFYRRTFLLPLLPRWLSR